jgi:hypothetical protein
MKYEPDLENFPLVGHNFDPVIPIVAYVNIFVARMDDDTKRVAKILKFIALFSPFLFLIQSDQAIISPQNLP